MRPIICHQCQTEQSSARDVCIECGAFMMRKPENFVGGAPSVIKPTLSPKPLAALTPTTSASATPAYVASGLAADTPMICCHACYAVQLAQEPVCTQCGKVMERRASYIFPASQLTQPYKGRLPTSQENHSPHPTTPRSNVAGEAQTAPPEESAPPKPANAQRICCHQCYAVQTVANSVCEKCNTFMKRDPQYLFDAQA